MESNIRGIIIAVIFVGIILLLFLLIPKPPLSDFECMKEVCAKYSTDSFDSCIDIGEEKTGFLSKQHYYLCNDDLKIPHNCIEYEEVIFTPKNRIDKLSFNCKQIPQ